MLRCRLSGVRERPDHRAGNYAVGAGRAIRPRSLWESRSSRRAERGCHAAAQAATLDAWERRPPRPRLARAFERSGRSRAAPHSRPADAVARELGSHLEHGLTAEDAAARLATHGPNRLPRPERPAYLRLAPGSSSTRSWLAASRGRGLGRDRRAARGGRDRRDRRAQRRARIRPGGGRRARRARAPRARCERTAAVVRDGQRAHGSRRGRRSRRPRRPPRGRPRRRPTRGSSPPSASRWTSRR